MNTIYDFIGDICTELGVNYEHGSYKSIQKVIVDSFRNEVPIPEVYPMLMLITEDMTEDVESNAKLETDYPLHIVIVNLTDPNYSNPERLENNFKPILYPIYNSLIEKLRPYSLNEFEELPHKKKDHFFYSTDDPKTANKIADYLDAIEITDLNIIINLNENKC